LDKSSASGGTTLLPILKETDHPCFECAKCCSYVALQIDQPSTMADYDHVVWYLYHKDVSVFVDWESDWYVKFETRCENLTDAGLCGVYDHRPGICKDFDWRECENHLKPEDGPPDKFVFYRAEEFLEWLEERRPKTHQRYQRFLRRKHAKGEEPELERVSGTPRKKRRQAPNRRPSA
jgi:Fe-S-cluster containining protein